MQFHLHLADQAANQNSAPKPRGPWVRVCLLPAELKDLVLALRCSAEQAENECSFAASVLRNRADMLAAKVATNGGAA